MLKAAGFWSEHPDSEAKRHVASTQDVEESSLTETVDVDGTLRLIETHEDVEQTGVDWFIHLNLHRIYLC